MPIGRSRNWLLAEACCQGTCLWCFVGARELLWEGQSYSYSLHSDDFDELAEQQMSKKESALYVTLTHSTRISAYRRNSWTKNKETPALPVTNQLSDFGQVRGIIWIKWFSITACSALLIAHGRQVNMWIIKSVSKIPAHVPSMLSVCHQRHH